MDKPGPLRGVDNNKSGFTYTSIVKRLPLIINQTISENNYDLMIVAQLRQIESDIISETGKIVQFIVDDASDNAKQRIDEIQRWKTYTQKFVGKTWLEAPWYLSFWNSRSHITINM